MEAGMRALLLLVVSLAQIVGLDANRRHLDPPGASSIHCNSSHAHSSLGHETVPWCIPRGYEVTKPPFLYKPPGEQKMNLSFTFSIREISEVKDSDQVLKIPMYFTVAWEENRLMVDPEHRSWADDSTGPMDETTEEAETLEQLWRPNLEIYGLEEFTNHKILGQMAGLRITKNKWVKYDTKVTIEISCQMDFSQYPFDRHVCFFQVGSYFYNKNSMMCTSELFDPSSESDFKERSIQHHVTFRNLSEGKGTVRLNSGEYAACGFEVLLTRKHEPLVYQVYIPCILFVTVSWISFIIDPKVVPGRMSLLVILFLVIINVFNDAKSGAPAAASSKLNAIDRYIVICIFSIFSAIIEYAIILSMLTLRPDKSLESHYSLSAGEGYTPTIKDRLLFLVYHPRILDVISISCFSSFFITFNIYYWFIADYTTTATSSIR